MSQYYHDPSNPLQKVPVQQTPQQQPPTTLNQQAGLAPQPIQQPTYNPNPPDLSAPVSQQNNVITVRNDYRVASVNQVPITTHAPEAPLQKTEAGSLTTYSFEPKPIAQQSQTPNLNSPLQQGIMGKNFGKAGVQGNFNQMSNVNFNPGNLTPEQRIVGIETAAATIMLPIIGPATAIKAAALNVGISEGMRFIPSNSLTGEYQGKFGTPTQIVGEASQGIIFAGIGKGLLSGLGKVAATQINPVGSITARLAYTAPGRVATFTALGGAIGGGSEYITTGQVTPRGVATGAAFGLAFSAGGEIISRIGQSPSIQNKVNTIREAPQNQIINRNIERLSNIDERYQQSYMNYESFKPTFGEKLTMKVTGLEPYKPAPQTVGLPKTPSMSTNQQLKASTLEVANMADPGTTLQGRSTPQQYTPTKLGENPYKTVLGQGLTATKTRQEDTQLLSIEKLTNQSLPRSTDTQLTNIEQLTKQQLPRQTDAQTERALIDSKINARNFDAQSTSAKIDTQLKQSTNFFDSKTANTNMERALQEARAEKAQANNTLYPEVKQSLKEFNLGIENTKGYPAQKTGTYLIKQPANSNLNLSDQINIRSPNTFNSAEVNTKINSMLNEVPTKGSYDNYNKTMSQGQTTTATRTRVANNQLFNLEQMINNPLPRSINNQSHNILPNSFASEKTLPKSKQELNTRLIPSVNFDSTMRSVTNRMNTQFSGTDLFTSNRISNRLKSSTTQEVKTRIGEQQTGLKTAITTGQSIGLQGSNIRTNISGAKIATGLGQVQRQGGQRTVTAISTPTTGIGIWSKITTTTMPTISPTTMPTISPIETITQGQGQGGFLGNTLKVGSLPFGGSQFEGKSFPSFGGGKKAGVRSYKREYPTLTGEELLGF
jgi:hypothetical protein